MSTHRQHVLTAHEFIEQGTTAGAIMSIATANHRQSEVLRTIARQVAAITGQSLQIPGELTEARKVANDNRRGRRAA